MKIKNLDREKSLFGKEVLGPIYYEFCHNLYYYIKNMQKKDTLILFIARDGLRIRYLLNKFIEINNLEKIQNQKEFLISRSSVISGCLKDDFDYVSSIIYKEFQNYKVKDFLKAFLKKDYDYLDDKTTELKMNKILLKKIYFSKTDYGYELREHFKEQSNYFKSYIKWILENNKDIILIDTGWMGNIQGMLMSSFKDITWSGLYFGKWDYNNSNPIHLKRMIGISICNNNLNIFSTRQWLLFYHNLFEAPLEPKIPSINKFVNKKGKIVPDVIIEYNKITPQKEEDFLFLGIFEYFNSHKKMTSYEIYNKAEVEYKKLKKKIMYPKKNDLDIMDVYKRGADIGRDIINDAIIKDKVLKSPLKKVSNIFKSLWRQGQIRYEFPITAVILQFLFNSYFLIKGKIKLI